MDPAGIKHLRDILKDISRKDNVAVFVSSHILSEMELMCDKVAVIDKGKLIKIENVHNLSGSSNAETETSISVKQLGISENILREEGYEVKVADEKIVVKASQDEVPKILKLLIKNDVDVFSVTPKEKSLEDIFFDATGNKGGQKNENA